MNLFVKVEFHPTEEKTKVLRAVENIFPNLEFKEVGDILEAIGEDLNDLAAFKEFLKVQGIRNTARSFLEGRTEDNNISFDLNKQAAFMGEVNFVDFDMALGTIKVEIKEAEGVIDWLTN